MEVLVGSSSSSAPATSSLFLNQNDVVERGGGLNRNGAGGSSDSFSSSSSDSFSSSSSSSIGAPDDSEEEDKDDVTDSEEVESKFNCRGSSSVGSMNSLEDSLPIKRGLSNYFSGKSKSFASLSDVVTTASTVKEIEKKDNPLNKRRRVLIASKWHRKSSSVSSFYNNANPKSMPSLPLLASLKEDEEEEELSSSDEKEASMIRTPRLVDKGLKKNSFKSVSCYCLSDLQGHDDEH